MKKALLTVAVVATAAIAGWNYQQSKQEVELSDLAMANVEALARGENDSLYHLFPCPSTSGNECRMKDSERPACHSATYCR